MTNRVDEYLREDGSNPYKACFDSLEPRAAAKVITAKLPLELGNTSSVKWFDGMGDYVIEWGPGYRLYLAKDGETLIVLFSGGTKRGQQRDIDRAKRLFAEYKARKKALARKAGGGKERGKGHGTDTQFQANGSRAGRARSGVRSSSVG